VSSFAEYQGWLVVEVAGGTGSAGPATIAGKLLADLGCTVARIDGGAVDRCEETDCERELFQLQSRGKHSVALDWRSTVVGEPLAALLAKAEIAIVDREGLMRLRSALCTEDLHPRFPQLTLCAASWFGLDGPLAAWEGGEEIVQAVTGIMSITGHPGSGPTRVAGAPFTHAAAMFAVTSSLGDVRRKRRGEAPVLLDVSVYDAAIGFESASLPAYFLTGKAPSGIGNRHSMSVPWNSFRCADGWVIICAGNHPNWVRLCEMIGRPEMVADPRFSTQEDRIACVDEIEDAVTAWTSTRSVVQVEMLLHANTIAGGSILPLHDVIDHPQFRTRNLIDDASHERQSGGVFHLDRAPLDIREGMWRAGAGSRAMLVERCGASLADFERWVAAGAVRTSEPGGLDHAQTA
jgi:crotonobetainyl-CoA:carnitine CoA-transferase CaiB-like acyl-CoA transferase